NGSGTYNSWTPALGSYTLQGTPFTGQNGTGTAGTSLTVHFTVVNQTGTPTPTPTPTATPTATATATATATPTPTPIPTPHALPLTNADFETGPFWTRGAVTGWTLGGTGHVSDNGQAFTSPTHGAAFSEGGDSQGDTLSQSFLTTAGKVYTVDFDAGVYGTRTGNPLQLEVQVLGTAGTLLDQTVTPPDAGTVDTSSVVFQHYHY